MNALITLYVKRVIDDSAWGNTVNSLLRTGLTKRRRTRMTALLCYYLYTARILQNIYGTNRVCRKQLWIRQGLESCTIGTIIIYKTFFNYWCVTRQPPQTCHLLTLCIQLSIRRSYISIYIKIAVGPITVYPKLQLAKLSFCSDHRFTNNNNSRQYGEVKIILWRWYAPGRRKQIVENPMCYANRS